MSRDILASFIPTIRDILGGGINKVSLDLFSSFNY